MCNAIRILRFQNLPWAFGSKSLQNLCLTTTDVCSRWYKGLAPKTRMLMGVGIMAYAGFGLFVSDKIEEHFGMTPNEKDYEEVRKLVPKISIIDRKQ